MNEPVALIVEDNDVNRLVAVQMLKRAGVVADQAASGEEALTMLQGRRYDVVLMDIQMPGMDGIDATRSLRAGDAGEANRWVPVVAMTAYASSDDVAACYEAGMSYYLSKPLSLQGFVDTVQTALAAPRTEPSQADNDSSENRGEYDKAVALRAAGGDEAATARLAQVLIETLEAELPGLQQKIENGDLAGVATVARALWTSAAQAGATRLRRLLRKIEASATDSDRAQTQDRAAELPAALSSFRTEVASHH